MSSQKTIDETLQPYVEKALQGLEKGAEFALDMAPELIQEFYIWHTAKSSIAVFFAIVFCFIAYKLIRKEIELDWEVVHYGMTGAVLGVIGVPMLLIEGYNLIFILAAPRLYLIDYFLN